MKQICSILLSLLILLSLSLPAYGAEEPLDYVVDYADLLTDEEEELLQQQIQESKVALQLDIVIVTIDGTDGKSVQAYADDFYDNNGYGYGENYSGILLLLNMQEREWYMSTRGEAIYIYTDYALDSLGSRMLPDLSAGDYYGAFNSWLSNLAEYVDSYRGGVVIDGFVQPDEYESPYGDETVYYESHGIKNPFPIAMALGLIVAAVTILIMRGKMNTAKLRSGAEEYLVNGSFMLRQRSDVFLYSRVTRNPRPKSNSGSGSSVHRSSGGARHGGRGGKF